MEAFLPFGKANITNETRLRVEGAPVVVKGKTIGHVSDIRHRKPDGVVVTFTPSKE